MELGLDLKLRSWSWNWSWNLRSWSWSWSWYSGDLPELELELKPPELELELELIFWRLAGVGVGVETSGVGVGVGVDIMELTPTLISSHDLALIMSLKLKTGIHKAGFPPGKQLSLIWSIRRGWDPNRVTWLPRHWPIPPGGALGQVSYGGVQLWGPNPYPILGKAGLRKHTLF